MKSKSFLFLWLLLTFAAFTTRAWAKTPAPVHVYAAPGNAQAAVRFDVPASTNTPFTYNVTVNNTTTNATTTLTGFTAGPILVPSLLNGDTYTFQVTAVDSTSTSGTSSAVSNSVTPNTGLYKALAGRWKLSAVQAGAGAPYSSSCTDVIDNNGGFTGNCTDSHNDTITFNKAAIFVFPLPYGMIPLITDYSQNGVDIPASPFPDMVCQASPDNTFASCTATAPQQNHGGDTVLLATMSKEGSTYPQTKDLTGTWHLSFLDPGAGGTGGNVTQGTANVSSNGAFKASGTGISGTQTGVLALSPAGVLTCASGDCNSDLDAYMDAGLTTMAGIHSKSGGDSQLQLFMKQGSSYSLADLAGLWEMNQLDSDGTWRRATLKVQSNGSMLETDYGNGGDTGSGSGTLRISSAGVVTCSSGDCKGNTFSMDASETIMGTTQTKSHSGSADTFRMLVFTKTASPPSAPTGVSATAGNGSATVGFTAPPIPTGGSPIASYTVTSSPGAISRTGTGTSIKVTGLKNGTAYTFTVTATNAAGLTGSPSAKSNSVKPVDPALPHAPTGVTAKAGNAQATVNFKLPSSGGPFTCTVTSNPGNITAAGSGSPITITGLKNGTTYTFRVSATNAVGTSPSSGPSNKVTPADVPDAPSITNVTAGNGQATVTFTAPNANGSPITGYTVTSSSDATHPNGVAASGKKTQITVKGLSNRQSYTFTVTAKNKIGTGPASKPSSSVTPGA
ncbi:MAG: fibronectin type III domain-containing protein [Syntrophobacteraceae bacterium]|nr:fibronectin type III domain-containing protein [Syntrophobacteraceae bacterium]